MKTLWVRQGLWRHAAPQAPRGNSDFAVWSLQEAVRLLLGEEGMRKERKGNEGERCRKILLAAVLLLPSRTCLRGAKSRRRKRPLWPPYDMSQDQQGCCPCWGWRTRPWCFPFKPRRKRQKVTAHTYVLEDGVWVENGGVSLLREAGKPAPCRGVRPGLSPGPQHGPAPDAQGRVSFSSDPVPFEGERLSAARGVIPESQPAAMGGRCP